MHGIAPFLIALIFISATATAESRLYYAPITQHVFIADEITETLNEDTGLLVLSVNGWTAGHMQNSYYRESWLGGYTARRGNFTYGLLIASGYRRSDMVGFGKKLVIADEFLPYPFAGYSKPITDDFSIAAVYAVVVLNIGVEIKF